MFNTDELIEYPDDEPQIHRIIVSAGKIASCVGCSLQVYYTIHGIDQRDNRSIIRGRREHRKVDNAIREQGPAVLEQMKFPFPEEVLGASAKEPGAEKPRDVYIVKSPLVEEIETGLINELVPFNHIAPGEKMFSERYRMVGKPDMFLVSFDYEELNVSRGFRIPIEMKGWGPRDGGIYPQDMAQEIVYCMLEGDKTGTELGFGLVYYQRSERKMRSFDITPEMRKQVLLVRDEVARMERDKNKYMKRWPIVIPSKIRCGPCKYLDSCQHPSSNGDDEYNTDIARIISLPEKDNAIYPPNRPSTYERP